MSAVFKRIFLAVGSIPLIVGNITLIVGSNIVYKCLSTKIHFFVSELKFVGSISTPVSNNRKTFYIDVHIIEYDTANSFVYTTIETHA